VALRQDRVALWARAGALLAATERLMTRRSRCVEVCGPRSRGARAAGEDRDRATNAAWRSRLHDLGAHAVHAQPEVVSTSASRSGGQVAVRAGSADLAGPISAGRLGQGGRGATISNAQPAHLSRTCGLRVHRCVRPISRSRPPPRDRPTGPAPGVPSSCSRRPPPHWSASAVSTTSLLSGRVEVRPSPHRLRHLGHEGDHAWSVVALDSRRCGHAIRRPSSIAPATPPGPGRDGPGRGTPGARPRACARAGPVRPQAPLSGT